MPSLEPILNHVAPFLLVLFRLSGLLVFAPMLSSGVIPLRVRALFMFALTLAVYPTIPSMQQAPVALDLFALGPAVIAETLIGTAIGLIAALPLYAAQLGGLVMSQQAGLTLGMIANPALDTESDAVGQLLVYMALAMFVTLGGLDALFLGVMRTFKSIPVGEVPLTIAPVDLILGLAGSGFELAVRVSAPVLCIILIETIVSALIMKSMPQLNIMTLGYAAKVLLMMGVLVAGIGAIGHAVDVDIANATTAILHWCDGAVAAPGGVSAGG